MRDRWGLDPTRNNNFLGQMGQQTDRLVGQSSQQGDLRAQGQMNINGAPGMMIEKGLQGYGQGNEFQAHKLRVQNTKTQQDFDRLKLKNAQAEDSWLDQADASQPAMQSAPSLATSFAPPSRASASEEGPASPRNKTVMQSGHTYIWNPRTGRYE